MTVRLSTVGRLLGTLALLSFMLFPIVGCQMQTGFSVMSFSGLEFGQMMIESLQMASSASSFSSPSDSPNLDSESRSSDADGATAMFLIGMALIFFSTLAGAVSRHPSRHVAYGVSGLIGWAVLAYAMSEMRSEGLLFQFEWGAYLSMLACAGMVALPTLRHIPSERVTFTMDDPPPSRPSRSVPGPGPAPESGVQYVPYEVRRGLSLGKLLFWLIVLGTIGAFVGLPLQSGYSSFEGFAPDDLGQFARSFIDYWAEVFGTVSAPNGATD